MFTFIVTCYQQSSVVIMALESVKYQIEHYGQGRKFQIIVADDGSTDGSREVIQRWTEQNRGLFEKIDLLFRKENAGICQNYVEALRAVEGEQFVKVDGDDLLTPYNVFELTEMLSEYDMVCPAFLKFSGPESLIRRYNVYLEFILQRFIKGKTLLRAVKLGCPLSGATIYRRSLLTQEVYDFILQFRTVNDRACFQKIITENPGIKTCYVNRPVILYRVSDTSISNFNSPSRTLHNQEIAHLCRIQRKAEQSILFQLLLLAQEKSAAFQASTSRFVRFLRFFSPYFAIMLGLCMAHPFSIRSMERELVDGHWQDCATHYQRIETAAADFLQQKPEAGLTGPKWRSGGACVL
ncbi:MAG: glycosyltransferase family 2 protein [Lawsonibacter sp.]|nr:glycosyltransferase family 2 protein [Lawsonibacter sp.]